MIKRRLSFSSSATRPLESTEEERAAGKLASSCTQIEEPSLELQLHREREAHKKTHAYMVLIMAEAKQTQAALDECKHELYVERFTVERLKSLLR